MSAREPLLEQKVRRSPLAWLLRWHHRLAWPAVIAALIWGMSGVLHPVMSALSPKPAATPAPVTALESATPLLVPKLASPMRSVRLMMLEGRPSWRLDDGVTIRWLNAGSLSEVAGAERREAERLARHFAAEPDAAIESITLLRSYRGEYTGFNKLLPVWRVAFARADGLTAYVDTEGQRLALLTDGTKRTLSEVFSAMHSWNWASEGVKRVAVTALVGSLLLTVAGGLAMYVLRRRAGTLKPTQAPKRRVHRIAGAIAGVAALMLTFSGLIHLWADRPGPAVAPAAAVTTLPALHHLPANASALVATSVNDRAVWLVLPVKEPAAAVDPHAHHHAMPKQDAGALLPYFDGHQLLPGSMAREHALAMAGRAGAARAPVSDVRLVESFGGDYAFIERRLPVYRVAYASAGSPVWFVEPATGLVSTRLETRDRVEGYVFSWLHKWHWLDALGKTTRDMILASFVLLTLLAALAGVLLWRRR
ncbi:PepSY domain-containing protein [Chitinibacteraceae bacterium HSL-7]